MEVIGIGSGNAGTCCAPKNIITPNEKNVNIWCEFLEVHKPMKKKILSVLIASALIASSAICLTSCSDDSSNNSGSSGSAVQDANKSNGTMQDKGELGKYAVEISSYKLAKDYEGKPAIVIEYQFTNNSDDAANFMTALNYKAFQDGIELETAIIADDNVYDSGASMKDIKTGKTLTVYSAYVLSDETKPVECEVTELISFDDKKVVKTFEIAQ